MSMVPIFPKFEKKKGCFESLLVWEVKVTEMIPANISSPLAPPKQKGQKMTISNFLADESEYRTNF